MSVTLSNPCKICGQNESVITVYRLWLGMLIISDECRACFEYLNLHCKRSLTKQLIIPIDKLSQI